MIARADHALCLAASRAIVAAERAEWRWYEAGPDVPPGHVSARHVMAIADCRRILALTLNRYRLDPCEVGAEHVRSDLAHLARALAV